MKPMMLVMIGFPDWLIWVAYVYATLGIIVLGLSWMYYSRDFRNLSTLVFCLLSIYTAVAWPIYAKVMLRDFVIWFGKSRTPKMRREARK